MSSVDVEVSLPDGTVVRWSVTDDPQFRAADKVLDAVEQILGPPDTIRA